MSKGDPSRIVDQAVTIVWDVSPSGNFFWYVLYEGICYIFSDWSLFSGFLYKLQSLHLQYSSKVTFVQFFFSVQTLEKIRYSIVHSILEHRIYIYPVYQMNSCDIACYPCCSKHLLCPLFHLQLKHRFISVFVFSEVVMSGYVTNANNFLFILLFILILLL